MKTIKTIAAVVLAMFVGNTNAALVITNQDIKDHMETMEVYYQAEDIDCEIWAKMFVKGEIEGNDKLRHGIRVHKDLEIVAMKAKSEFYSKYMGDVNFNVEGAGGEHYKERMQQIRDVYIGAYIGAADMISRQGEKKNYYDSAKNKKALANFWFDFCVKVKEEYPVALFNEWLAMAQLAEDDF